jgi:hypothetical protein
MSVSDPSLTGSVSAPFSDMTTPDVPRPLPGVQEGRIRTVRSRHHTHPPMTRTHLEVKCCRRRLGYFASEASFLGPIGLPSLPTTSASAQTSSRPSSRRSPQRVTSSSTPSPASAPHCVPPSRWGAEHSASRSTKPGGLRPPVPGRYDLDATCGRTRRRLDERAALPVVITSPPYMTKRAPVRARDRHRLGPPSRLVHPGLRPRLPAQTGRGLISASGVPG